MASELNQAQAAMIDHIKLWYESPDIAHIRSLDFLHFESRVSEDGELLNQVAEYRNLRIKLSRNNKLEISGSIHVFCQGFNDRDFDFWEFCETTLQLCNELKITPEKLRIRRFEFGVNFKPPIASKRFLDSIFLYQGKHFDKETFGGRGYMLRYENSRFYIKAYDKARHAKIKGPLVRYEVGQKKMEVISESGIQYLSDLHDPEKFASLHELLQKRIENIIMGNPYLKLQTLNPKDRAFISGLSSRSEWEALTTREAGRRKKRFRAIVEANSQSILKDEFKEIVSKKWVDLMVVF